MSQLPKGWDKQVSKNDWRAKVAELLRNRLEDYPSQSTDGCSICYYGTWQPAVIAVYDITWSLHVQCVYAGKEMQVEKYNLMPNDVLISLDVAENPDDMSSLDRRIAGMRSDIRRQMLKALEYMIPEAHYAGSRPSEHLVWEKQILLPFSDAHIEKIAERMAVYFTTLMPLATDVLRDNGLF